MDDAYDEMGDSGEMMPEVPEVAEMPDMPEAAPAEEMPEDVTEEIVETAEESAETDEAPEADAEGDGFPEDVTEEEPEDSAVPEETSEEAEDVPEEAEEAPEAPEEAETEETSEVPERPEYTEEEIAEFIKHTPVNNGEWSDDRGDSLWMPDDEFVQETLSRYDAEGIEYHDGLPDLEPFAAFGTELEESEYTIPNSKQFLTCNETLADYFEDQAEAMCGPDCDDPLESEEYRDLLMVSFHCDEDELEDIQLHLEQHETPYGYTWHHTEVPGQMLLVPSDIHAVSTHVGGQSIWGGGQENR
ncbi:MAG: HNH endonuclease [Lachnospiraceae bacterium]|nr:HNH endonuclease [Lachnospiraceae bacterium]MBQ9562211.1 HNH endonuclease [Lachnospiraceae bacterium]MBR0153704.1 HNH endonuclease [Lachnospiraceae bacterium]